MRRLLGVFTIVVAVLNMSEAQVPCNLTGGSVYIDHTSNPWMMNASVNGMSMYDVLWSNGSVGNQTQFYTNWCVSITDIISGCDTIICESCISDTLAVCPCPMIYSPVCGCDGNMYANDCIAICAGIYSFTPAIPNGTLGGFLPCTQPSSCEVEINGDSIICDWGSPQVLTASPTALSNPFVSYLWTNGQSNNNILTIIYPGTYCVIATDATGCVDSACITVSVQEIPIFSAPSPPIICLGDSVVLEIDTVGLSNIIWVPNTLLTPPVHRIVDSPISPQTYFVGAIDSSGCNRHGEIFVDVDSCILCIDSSLINPQIMCPMVVNPVCGCDGNTYMNDCEALNWYGVTSWIQGPCNPPSNFACMGGAVPGVTTCVGPGNYAVGQPNIVSVYSTMAACIADSCNVIPPPPSNFACMGGVVPGITTCVGPGNYAIGQPNVVSVYSTMAACIADSCNVIPPPPPCTVEINNGSVDIEMCDGDSVILEATIGFDTYLWTESSTAFPLGNTPTINVTNPGLYMVIATDIINNCVDMDSIQVIVYPSTPLNPITVPSPPIVCLGDSVVIEVNSGFLNYFWNTGNPLDEDEDRVVVYPTQDFIYVVEALDINGCESREEIEVFVDTCATSASNIEKDKIQIYPNPASEEFFINLNSMSFCNIEIIDVLGRLLIRKEHVNNSLSIKTIEFSKGTYFIRIQTHSDIQTYKIIIDR